MTAGLPSLKQAQHAPSTCRTLGETPGNTTLGPGSGYQGMLNQPPIPLSRRPPCPRAPDLLYGTDDVCAWNKHRFIQCTAKCLGTHFHEPIILSEAQL